MTDTKDTDEITITFECHNCGASPCTLTTSDDESDDAIASCKSCKYEHGRLGDIKAKAKELALAKAERMAQDTFDRIKRSWRK